jgi:diguanylate cyclase (GGDEF)-like protein
MVDPAGYHGAGRGDARLRDPLPETVAQSELLQRITSTVAILAYEMEVFPDGTFVCHQFLGLESIIGELPPGLSPEEAFDEAVHPDDREAYDATLDALRAGRPVEIEYRLLGYDGVTRWVFDRMHPREVGGRLLVDGVVADITERKRIAEQLAKAEELARLAHVDALTALPNRIAFEERLMHSLSRAARDGTGVAVLFIDLDNFKLVNDSFGHGAGDELLRAVATRLREAARASHLVARQGGDEFLVLLSDLELEHRPAPGSGYGESAETVAGEVRTALSAPFLVAGVEIFVTASVGIGLFPADADEAATLLKHADIAMYGAKEAGRDTHKLYEPGPERALEQLSMAARLRRTLEGDGGLVLHYQPLVDLEAGAVVGVEALVRWDDVERGLLPPLEFIPLAERIGLVGLIGDWVVDEACRQAARWQRRGVDLHVSINLTPSYCDATGVGHVLEAIDAHGLAPSRLMIELTESAIMAETHRRIEPGLARLRGRGIQLAIDDFGTGHSSLGRLSKDWVSVLKIDRSFVQDVPGSEQAERLVTSVVQLAHTMGFEPIAEGVETEAQRRFLLERGCRLGQGFLFSPPVPAAELERYLAGERPQVRAA